MQSRKRVLIAFGVTRCLSSIGRSIIQSSTNAMLMNLMKTKHGANYKVATARLYSTIGSISTLINFWYLPIVAAVMDSAGRFPLLVACPLLTGLSQLLLSLRPSVRAYVAYRVCNDLVMMPNFQAQTAALSDLVGRGSLRFSLLNSQLRRYSSVAQLGGRAVSLRLSDPRVNLLCGACLSLASALVTSVLGRETIVRRKPISLVGSSPLNFIPFFLQSKGLRALGILSLCSQLNAVNQYAWYYNMTEMMRSARHCWDQKDNSRFEFVGEVISFGETFTLGPMLAAFGPFATAIWGQRLGALKCLILGFAPKGRRGGWLLYLLHPLQLFRHGMSAQSMYEGVTPANSLSRASESSCLAYTMIELDQRTFRFRGEHG
eukprot:COSAG02_NODE_6078_length_3816_cov_6.455172_1_plen_374_part_10